MKYLILLSILIGCAAQTESPSAKYNRKTWKHWTDKDKNCLNTRHEILKSRSKTEVKYSKRKCTVKSGLWYDYYFPETHTLAKEVDIDHVVPLKHAHDHGGAKWTKKEKEIFANDPSNLVITKKEYNRKKGPKGIGEWLPIHKNYACKYIKDYQQVKFKYKLALTPEEKKAIVDIKCL